MTAAAVAAAFSYDLLYGTQHTPPTEVNVFVKRQPKRPTRSEQCSLYIKQQ